MQSFLAWVLTYAIHSTVLIVATWLVCRFVPRLSLASQDVLWKLALVGAIATTSVQSASGLTPPWGRFAMPAALATETAPTPAPAPVAAPTVLQHRAGDLVITARRESHASAAPVTRAEGPSAWPWVLASLIGFGAVIGLVRIGIAMVRLRRQLHARRDVIEDPVLETFLALCQKVEVGKRVRLTTSPNLQSPVALVRREICIPERAIFGLDPRQQQGMLAHELAHVLRRDPLWLVVAVLVESVFFFQPLNHLVRRKLQEVAEYECDDWAARHSGTGVHLAKCLAEVAGWIEREPPAATLASSMAGHRSPIVRRITRLLDDRSRSVGELGPATRVGAGLGMLVAVAWLAPGVDAAAATAVPATAVTAHGLARLEVEDVVDDGADRARLRIAGLDETVHVEVTAPRAPAPPPPPRALAPVPPPRDELRIRIEGGLFGQFPCCGHGWVEIDLFGLEHFDPWDELGPRSGWSEDFVDEYTDLVEAHAEALEDALEAREEALEDALERAEDARERAFGRAWEARGRAFAGSGRAARAVPPRAEGTVSL